MSIDARKSCGWSSLRHNNTAAPAMICARAARASNKHRRQQQQILCLKHCKSSRGSQRARAHTGLWCAL
eukprot:19250-Heterococcus_DN1.PRE.1